MTIQISMTDLVAEHKAYHAAHQRKMISKQMLDDSDTLCEALCKLCLSHQIETYNRMLSEVRKTTQDATPQENTNVNETATQ